MADDEQDLGSGLIPDDANLPDPAKEKQRAEELAAFRKKDEADKKAQKEILEKKRDSLKAELALMRAKGQMNQLGLKGKLEALEIVERELKKFH